MKAKARVAHPFSGVGVALILLGLALLVPAIAQAAQTHVLTESKGPDWGYSHPVSTAVDNGSGPHAGWTYNVDSGSNFVLGNEPDGTPALGFEPPGGYVKPVAVAVDPSTGDVWVVDEGPLVFLSYRSVIYKFDELGNYLTSISFEGDCPCYGLTPSAIYVDPSNGDLYAADSSAVEVFDSSGTFSRSIRPQRGPAQNQQTSAIRSIAVSPAGHLFLSDTINGENPEAQRGLDEFDGSGKFIRRYGDNSEARGVAYDAAKNQAIVNGGTYIAIYDAASGDEVDRFGADKLVEGTGVAVNEATGVVQVLDGSGWWYTFSPANLPNVTTGVVTGIAKSSATLNGTVDPAGAGDATCQFEYGETTEYLGAASPVACSPAGPYSAATDVSAELSGLTPATLYHYRLDASNSAGTLRGPDGTFTTGPDAPAILSQAVGDRGSDNARVDAQIQVFGASANVRVEYGTDTNYGATAPSAGKVVAASGPTDRAQKLVLQQLSGLSPNTTYHYCFVATNQAGTTVGPDQLVRTYPAPANPLPDGRGYELVTPLNKDGHSAYPGYSIAADNGEAVFYSTALTVGNTATGMQDFSVSRKVSGSWVSDSPYLRPANVEINHTPWGYWPSSDLSSMAFSGQGFADDDTRGIFISNRSGTVRMATGAGLQELATAGAAPDLNPTYFGAAHALLAGDPSKLGFYEFRDGQLRQAGVLPDGSLDPEGAAPAATPTPDEGVLNSGRQPGEFHNQVSADGTRAFFISPAPAAGSPRPVQLYVHREGQASLLASVSEVSGQPSSGVVPMQSLRGPCCHTDSPYASASPDGSHVFFESQDQLTADAPADGEVKGYLFDVDQGQLEYLPGASGTAISVSDDGRRVFFVSDTGLALWEAGAGVVNIAPGVGTMNVATATPDGSTLIFTPLNAPAGFNSGGLPQVYRYDTATRVLDCISCPPEGVTPNAAAFLSAEGANEFNGTSPSYLGELRAPHYYAADGHRVFFQTDQKLVATDTNSTGDVYEWEDGATRLISAGNGSEPSFLVDSSVSGDDVFFGTSDGLDPRDQDGGIDVYDARVGAAEKGAATDPASCAGSCQGEAASATPSRSHPGSSTFAGAGNRRAAEKPRLSVRQRSAKGSSFRLTVRTKAGGHLVASGPDVQPVSRKVSVAGSYRLTMALNARARKKLEQERRLTVRVRVSFTPPHGKSTTTSVSVTLEA